MPRKLPTMLGGKTANCCRSKSQVKFLIQAGCCRWRTQASLVQTTLKRQSTVEFELRRTKTPAFIAAAIGPACILADCLDETVEPRLPLANRALTVAFGTEAARLI
jgi:hypothetical protein